MANVTNNCLTGVRTILQFPTVTELTGGLFSTTVGQLWPRA